MEFVILIKLCICFYRIFVKLLAQATDFYVNKNVSLPSMLTFSALVEIIYLKGKSSLLSFTTLRANTHMEIFN